METIEKVNSGYRMPSPEDCPSKMYKLMAECWDAEPLQRPSFKELFQSIDRMREESSSYLLDEDHYTVIVRS